MTMIDEEKYQDLLQIAKTIHSPLTDQDIAFLVEYGQTNTPQKFVHYMLIQNIWEQLNGAHTPLDRCIEGNAEYDMEDVGRICFPYLVK